jgi:hypothetical protein
MSHYAGAVLAAALLGLRALWWGVLGVVGVAGWLALAALDWFRARRRAGGDG